MFEFKMPPHNAFLTESKLLILIVALLGRFADSAVFAVIILHTSELFPTSNRNTAIGTSLAVSQLGSISAPYVVDILVCRRLHYKALIFLFL